MSYDLYKLGWRAFQDLVAVVLAEVLGQTFHAFADSNDAGRDGAFHGQWTSPGDGDGDGDSDDTDLDGALAVLRGHVATVAQCKFSAASTATLTPSMLTEEVGKMHALHARGLCDAYLLVTNLGVTGRTDQWLREQATAAGVSRSLVLDGRWISRQISRRPVLRRYVPRVYGLGDLGQILDDRRLQQAQALLARLGENLTTFVPTEAYRAAADALADHGFVLLLGEPAAGKSTIAATLAVAALDNWGSSVARVDSAAELVSAWNPADPDRLFWVDDAFGAIRHDPRLTDEWSRRLDQVMAAVAQGAKVILTSRDYIYRDARLHLKEYAYPLLREQTVVVDVATLTSDERRRILYNQLKAGDQPAAVLRRWQPHLHRVANLDRFQPEVARRLGRTAFTRGLALHSHDELIRYFERPVAFLVDVLRQLDPPSRAALGCVYLAGDALPAPVMFDQNLRDALARLGATEAEALRALTLLNGTFLSFSTSNGEQQTWRFKHPTIREGYAAVVAEDPNAVQVFLDGLTDDELAQQVDCGGASTRGTLVRVPATLYDRVVTRVRLPAGEDRHNWYSPAAFFLQHRSSPAFLRAWAEHHAASLDTLLRFDACIDAYWQPRVLGVLHGARALPEPLRHAAIDKLADLATLQLDAGWLESPVRDLFERDELVALLLRVRDEVVPDLDDHISESADGYDDDVEPESRYETARTSLRSYQQAFQTDAPDPAMVARMSKALDHVADLIYSAEDDRPAPTRSRLAEPPGTADSSPSTRDDFDDLALGR